MKLATLRNGSRDGALTIVDHDMTRAVSAVDIAPTLQAALDDWSRLAPVLRRRYDALNDGRVPGIFDIDWRAFSAPLPRAYAWMDSSVYLSHMELARQLRGSPMPQGYRDEPRFYDGVSTTFRASGDPLPCPRGDIGLDIEGELAVILDDVAQRTSVDAAVSKILLFALVNDTSLRTIFAEQAARGYTNYHGKPPCSMAPVVVTPDELGAAWDGRRASVAIECTINDKVIGRPDTGQDMAFDYPTVIAHASWMRPLGVGTVLGAGTVSNRDAAAGSACIAEVRMHEQLEFGAPRSRYLEPGDHIRIEARAADGHVPFGAIEHRVVAL